MNKEKTSQIVCLLFILITAAFLRMRTLGIHSFWDDDVTYLYMSRNFSFFIGDSASFYGLTLFLSILNIWNRFTNDQTMLLLMPVSLGVCAVWLIFLLGTSLVNRQTGLFAGLFLALSPLHVYYSQELKAYPLLMTVILASILFLNRCLRNPKAGMKNWVILGILNAAVLYTHYVGGLLLIAMSIFVLCVRHRIPGLFKTFLKSAAITTVLYGPWLISGVIGHFSHISRFVDSWVPHFHLRMLVKTAYHLSAGYHSPQKIGIMMTVILFGLALYAIICSHKLTKDRGTSVFLLVLLIVVPLGCTIIITQWRNVYLDRYLMFLSLPLFILAAIGLSCIKRGVVTFAILSMFAILSIMPLAFIHLNRIPREDAGIYMRKDVRAATRYLEKHVESDDVIVHSSNSCINGLRYYHEPSDSFQQIYGVLRETEFLRFTGFIESASRINQEILPRFLPTAVLDLNSFWFVYSSWATSYDEEEPTLVKDWLLARFDCLSTWKGQGITIMHLQRRGNDRAKL